MRVGTVHVLCLQDTIGSPGLISPSNRAGLKFIESVNNRRDQEVSSPTSYPTARLSLTWEVKRLGLETEVKSICVFKRSRGN